MLFNPPSLLSLFSQALEYGNLQCITLHYAVHKGHCLEPKYAVHKGHWLEPSTMHHALGKTQRCMEDAVHKGHCLEPKGGHFSLAQTA